LAESPEEIESPTLNSQPSIAATLHETVSGRGWLHHSLSVEPSEDGVMLSVVSATLVSAARSYELLPAI
jgi:hypothetical protein